jgi:hypothetical protein
MFIGAMVSLASSGGVTHGRPFRVRGRRKVAEGAEPADWAALTVSADHPEAMEREAIIRYWNEQGLDEHASIAAFARLQLELLGLGAPARLVERVGRATLEESMHARLCFSLARAYSGQAMGPGSFSAPMSRDLPKRRAAALAMLARETLIDGCMNEALAAALAMEAAADATAPHVQSAFSTIAADEQEHAGLSWEILEWCAVEAPFEVAQAVVEATHVLRLLRDRRVRVPNTELPAGAGHVSEDRAAELAQQICTGVMEGAARLTAASTEPVAA